MYGTTLIDCAAQVAAPGVVCVHAARSTAECGCVWAGIWLTVSVISSAPPVSARMKPLPRCRGSRPRRSGSANVALAVAAVGRADQVEQRLVLGDRQQLALAEHPSRGGEVAREHANLTDIWLGHGSGSSVRRREDALQGDAEVQGQEGLHVEVRLAAADVRHRVGTQRRHAPDGTARVGVVGAAEVVAVRRWRTPPGGVVVDAATMWLCVGSSEMISVCACSPPRSPSVWPRPTWIGTRARRSGRREVHAAVAAERRPQQREQRLVLVDRQQLPVAQRPPLRGEDEATSGGSRTRKGSAMAVVSCV